MHAAVGAHRGQRRSRRGLQPAGVACPGSGVGEAAADLGDELPVVAVRAQGELEDAEARVVARLEGGCVAGGDRRDAVVLPTGAHDELTDPVAVREPCRALGRVALVVVVAVTVQHDVGPRRVEVVPELRRLGVVSEPPGVESRVVPVGEGAHVRMRGEVALEPLLLRAAVPAAAHEVAVRVERDQVPAADVEAVVAARLHVRGVGAGGGADPVEDTRAVEVVEVTLCPRRVVLGVAEAGVGDRVDAAEGRLVDGLEVRQLAGLVLVVPQRQEGVRNRARQQIGDVALPAVVLGSVAGVVVGVVGRTGHVADRRHDRVGGMSRGYGSHCGQGRHGENQQARPCASHAQVPSLVPQGQKDAARVASVRS